MKVSIVVPVFHSSDILFDFTKQILESIQSENHDLSVYVIVNYSLSELYPTKEKFKLHESIKNFTVINNSDGNKVVSSWNLGIKTALADGNDFVIVANNDLVLHHKCIDNLLVFADMHPEFILWSASEWIDIRTLGGIKEADITWEFSEHPHFSFFMVNQKTIDTIGWFDENLQLAYFEDSDFHTRILLSGNKAGKTESAKFYHYGSRTIKVDEVLYDQNKRSYEDNRNYLLKKWGLDYHGKMFVPPEEVLKEAYQNPFNDPNKSIKNW